MMTNFMWKSIQTYYLNSILKIYSNLNMVTKSLDENIIKYFASSHQKKKKYFLYLNNKFKFCGNRNSELEHMVKAGKQTEQHTSFYTRKSILYGKAYYPPFRNFNKAKKHSISNKKLTVLIIIYKAQCMKLREI